MTAGPVDAVVSIPDSEPVVSGVDGPAISAPMVAALEAAWSAVRDRNPELPPVVIVLGAGSGDRGGLRLGHFAAMRWSATDVDEDGHRLAEVFVGGEGLARGPVDMFGTLLHEAAHALAHVRGVQDTSRQGRWHNARFKALAEEVGVAVEKDPRLGWSPTTVPDATRDAYAPVIAELGRALRMRRASETTGGAEKPKKPGPPPFVCACGRRIRVAVSVRAAGPIVCGICEAEFLPEESTDDPDGSPDDNPDDGEADARSGHRTTTSRTTRTAMRDNRSSEGRPGDGFLAGHSRRAALSAPQQMTGEEPMLRREHDPATVRDHTGDPAHPAGRDWRDAAACRAGAVSPEVFFPAAEGGPALRAQEARAKGVCAGCAVIDACRAWAVDALPDGIAGGLTAAERRRLRAASGPPTPRPTEPARRGGWASALRRVAAVRQVEAGRSYAGVAAEFGVSDRTVARWHSSAVLAGSGGAR